jgi:long-chain acyl-CoA synthetase
MGRQSIGELVDVFYGHGREPAYVHRRGLRLERWSYRRVAEAARRFARELEARGIGKGERVMLWGENCAEWVAAFLGCTLRGAVVVPMDAIAAEDFAARVARQVEARLLIRSRHLPSLNLPSLEFEAFEESLSGHSADPYREVEVTPTDTLQIVFTSGTTTEPKGVVISHRNVLVNLEPLEREILKYRKYGRIFHPLRFLNLLPLSHVFGQFLGIFVPQVISATVIFQDSLSPAEVIHTIKRERVSVLITVPRLLETLKAKLERDWEAEGRLDWYRKQMAEAEGEHFTRRWWRFRRVHNLFGWKFWAFVSGGATLDRETENFWGRLSFVVIQGYGLTETTSLISVNHPFRLGKGSIGKVLPGREIKLAEDGEILVRGENIAAGYWKGQQLVPVEGEEGWFHTGDVGELDANGNLYFKGRKKNVIVTPAGMKVYPEDLEAALRQQPEVKDCVVLGLERDGNAEACAALILKPAAEGDARAAEERAAEAVKRANATLADFQRIRHWVVWPEEDFPRTSTQKPRTSVIAERIQRMREPAPATGAAAGAPAAGALGELIARITGRTALDLRPDAHLAADLGLSSIDRVELISALEDRFQIDLNETKFTAATTLADLERMLREPAVRRSEMYYPRWTLTPWQNWIRVAIYYLFIRPGHAIFGWPRVRGRENLKGVRGPVIVICNHISQVDIGFVLWALPARLRHRLAVAMEGEYLERLRNPAPEIRGLARWVERFKWFACVAWFNAFPMASRSGVRESFAYCGEAVDRGYNLCIFPEGQRTKHGGMNPFRAGIGLLVERLRLPVVPLRIDGLWPYRAAGKKFARPGSIRVSIGPPVRFPRDAQPADITRQLEVLVASMEWKE